MGPAGATLLLLLFCCPNSLAQSCASVSFSERVITNSADGAVSVFALDVDGDGAVNVLSASYNADTVAWYENDASQSFTERVITDSFDGAYSVFAIDVDGDGDVDALSASYSHDTSFAERVITTLADNARSVYAIDVDGDGIADTLSASSDDDTVAWYENDGSQSFTERIITTLADNAISVFAIDVDGDGDNDGSESFAERVITNSADGAQSVFAVDVDGDGDIDALSASAYDGTVAWYENDGSESFIEHIITTLPDQVISIHVIDLGRSPFAAPAEAPAEAAEVEAPDAAVPDAPRSLERRVAALRGLAFADENLARAEVSEDRFLPRARSWRRRARSLGTYARRRAGMLRHELGASYTRAVSARDVRALLREARAMAPAVADGVLARDEELQRIISGATDAAAVKNLKLLRTQHRSAWCWVPARRLFVANVTAILEERLHLAAHLDGELSAISGATPEETVVLREAKLFEYERIARLGATGRAIYFRALDFRAEDDEAPETPTRGAYVTGRAAYAALVAGLAYYVVAHGSELGNGRTKALGPRPRLREHFTKFEDPTRVRRFPFATRLPTSATFFVAAWHEELHGTRVGRYCLGDAVDDGVFDGSSRAMARIYADEAWRPSPAVRVSIALLGGLTVLPFSLQEVAFEEAFTVAPVVSALLFGPLLSPGGRRGRRSVDLATAVNLVGTILALVLAYGLYRAAAAAIDACAAKRRVDEADDYDAHSRRRSRRPPGGASEVPREA
ncbi:endonuclease [Aureococcus anophagefferens]|nr:endonuclease [Aureococcus anophagefferens]